MSQPRSELFIRLIDLKAAKKEAEKRLEQTHPLASGGHGRDMVKAEIDTISRQIAETGKGIDERG